MYTRQPNFSYTKYGGWRSYPYVKKSFKTQHGRIPIDPAILAAIGRRLEQQQKC